MLDFGNQAEWPSVLRIAQLVRNSGGRALLVGGGVRDALTEQPVKDFDIEIHGLSPEQLQNCIETEFALDRVGMSFGILKVKHHEIDLALPRTENKQGLGHRGFIVTPDPNLSFEQATARRDFTINAIMYDPLTGEIIDPQHGLADLQNQILRHVSAHFVEDPLRVLRGMQFAARFDFAVAPETLDLCRQLEIEGLPVERIGAEWEKLLLQGRCPARGLDFLRDTTWLRYFPELNELSAADFDGLKIVLNRGAKRRPTNHADALIFMSTLLAHQLPPAQVLTLLSRLWRRRELPEWCARLLGYRDFPIKYEAHPTPDGELRRLALNLKGGRMSAEIAETIYNRPLPRFRARLSELAILNQAPTPLLMGKHLSKFNIAPGPEMGKYLKLAFEAQLDGVFSTVPEGLTYLAAQIK